MDIRSLSEGRFVPFFQPQFNYDSRSMTGVEVLVRWIGPDGSIVSPGCFIKELENNDQIYEMDRQVWLQTCVCLSKWKSKGYPVPSISVNVSRRDLYHDDMADYLTALLNKYGIGVRDLHLEITESAYSEDTSQLLEALHKLKDMGFVIEMDDFGSGYSSLCALKDMPIDVLKLDGNFLLEDDSSHRCGKIITAVVNMAHSIDMPVIAEGVETKEEADFLKSVGCRYMQGYLFSRPLPEAEFETTYLERGCTFEMSSCEGYEIGDGLDFFDINSQNTLIFNSFVGGAAIITRDHEGKVMVVRMNDRYLSITGLSRESYQSRQYDLLSGLSRNSAKAFSKALDDALSTKEEASCTTLSPNIDGRYREFWSFNRLRLLARKVGLDVFYLTIEDITDRILLTRKNRALLVEIEERESIFMNAAKQVDLYFWKYDIRSKAMYPCFRCQENLGLPKTVQNYPEPAIDMCIFPEGDKYREIMARVDNGEDIDEIIPLTKQMIPYRVRYTVKRDSKGRPSVAYATALPVVSV